MQFQEKFFEKHTFHEVVILLLQKGETTELPLTGHCMKPLLRENDLITVKPITIDQLQCGDIVLYHIEGRLKCHRFLTFKTIEGRQYLITKSDRRSRCDTPVPFDSFLGTVIRVKKVARTVDYETAKWKRINYCLGKLSPYISIIEHCIKLPIRFPRKCASRLFRLAMGTNYRAWRGKRKNSL